jgi:CubicO group peptidase (beta-lactamase class C family)
VAAVESGELLRRILVNAGILLALAVLLAAPAPAASTLEEQLDQNRQEMDWVERSERVSVPAATPPAISANLSGQPTYPIGNNATCWQEQNNIGCFTNMDKVFPMRNISRGGVPAALPKANASSVRYRFQNTDYEPREFLDHHRILGLLILKDGQIVQEHYRHGTGSTTRFYSASMAKTVVGMLIGIALDKQLIKSIDDAAERYVPELKGSAYGRATIAQLLRMSSGVRMTPFGAPGSDEERFFQTERGLRPQPVLDFLRDVQGGEFAPGSQFRYMSTDTVVLGYVLTRASSKTVSELCSEWIWQHIGADQDAQWRLMKDGVEYGGGDMFATLRDYGRLGMLMARGGNVSGTQLIPGKWLEAATDPDEQPWAFKPLQTKYWFGYGLQTWIFPLRTTTFAMRGAWGQSIFIQPKSRIVMVITSALQTASNRTDTDERHALWYGVLNSLDGYTY